VALPMDEQRILEEMERQLADDDPRLAARLAAFGQPGIGQVLRTRRARATMSLMMLVLVAAVASVIYMMSAFRPGGLAPSSPLGHHVTSSSAPKSPPAINPLRCASAHTAAACGGKSSAPSGQSSASAPAGKTP
jgi:Protein of unknown function (DUF3040)